MNSFGLRGSSVSTIGNVHRLSISGLRREWGDKVRMRFVLLPVVVASTRRAAREESVVVIEGH